MGMTDSASSASAWRRYRCARWAFWILFLSFLPGLAFLDKTFHLAANGHGGVILLPAFAWMIAFAVAGYLTGNFQCPRCGKLFFKKFDDRPSRRDWSYNPLARRCRHCGLPKWSEN